MRNKSIIFVLLSILLIFSNSIGLAAKNRLPQPSYSFYVYDEGNIIEEDVESYIIKTNSELNRRTGVQIVVASILDLQGMDIKLFANELFKEWEIGSKANDNGLLILVAPEDREIWVEVGYGLEGALPDSKVGNIIKNSMLPHFRENDYSAGILLGFNQIIDEVEEEYGVELGREEIDWGLYNTEDLYNERSPSDRFGAIFIIAGIIFLLFIDNRFFKGWILYSLLRGNRRGGSTFSGRGRSTGGGRTFGGGGRSGGGGAGGRW